MHYELRLFLMSNAKFIKHKLAIADKKAVVTFNITNDKEGKWTFDNTTLNFKDFETGAQSPIIIVNREEVHAFASEVRFWRFLEDDICTLCYFSDEECVYDSGLDEEIHDF